MRAIRQQSTAAVARFARTAKRGWTQDDCEPETFASWKESAGTLTIKRGRHQIVAAFAQHGPPAVQNSAAAAAKAKTTAGSRQAPKRLGMRSTDPVDTTPKARKVGSSCVAPRTGGGDAGSSRAAGKRTRDTPDGEPHNTRRPAQPEPNTPMPHADSTDTASRKGRKRKLEGGGTMAVTRFAAFAAGVQADRIMLVGGVHVQRGAKRTQEQPSERITRQRNERAARVERREQHRARAPPGGRGGPRLDDARDERSPVRLSGGWGQPPQQSGSWENGGLADRTGDG